jgi:YfiH family protein
LAAPHGFGLRGSDRVELESVSFASQVHGVRALRAPADPREEADALYTFEPGHGVAIRTADCVPLLFATPDGRGVAAVHAGWRGTAAGIAALACDAFCRAADVAPADLVVAIGPHIGPCCYEVDAPVRAAFDDDGVFESGRPGHWSLDLGAANHAQLETAGVPRARIHRVGGCTHCHPDEYPSHRRDGTGDRMVHWIRRT